MLLSLLVIICHVVMVKGQGSYDCKFVPGYGKGSMFKPKSQTRGSCVRICIGEKKLKPTINRVTVHTDTSQDGCWCYYARQQYQTCALQLKSTGFYGCTFVPGVGIGLHVTPKSQIRGSCVRSCIEEKTSWPTINMVTVHSNPLKNGCWCYYPNPQYKTCALQLKSTGSYDCTFLPGVGTGIYHTSKSQIRGSCVGTCIKKKTSKHKINRVTVYSDTSKDGCWCYNSSPQHQTCVLQLNSTGSYECTFVPGAGWGLNFAPISQIRKSCVKTCIVEKISRPTINMVTVYSNTSKDGCWCYYGFPQYQTCSLRLKSTGSYDCTFVPGAATGLFIEPSPQTRKTCVKTCIAEKTTRPTINKVTVYTDASIDGCWCYYGKTGIDTNTTYQTCELLPNSTVNEDWGKWTRWSVCPKSCGVGKRSRSRECYNFSPSNGSRQCDGSNNEVEDCTKGACPAWSSWGYTACGGNGTRQALRVCESELFSDDLRICETEDGRRVRIQKIEQECTQPCSAEILAERDRTKLILTISIPIASLAVAFVLVYTVCTCIRRKRQKDADKESRNYQIQLNEGDGTEQVPVVQHEYECITDTAKLSTTQEIPLNVLDATDSEDIGVENTYSFLMDPLLE